MARVLHTFKILWNTVLKELLNLVFGPEEDLSEFLQQFEDIIKKYPAPQTEDDWIMALLKYDNHITSKLIWSIKYKASKEAVEIISPYLWELILNGIDAEYENQIKTIFLVPVPMHWLKKMKKGFNQTEIIAEHIRDASIDKSVICQKIVKKTKMTKSQVGLSKYERKNNLANSFVATIPKGIDVTNTLFVIIDDVVTTGTTMREIRKTLFRAGAKRVIGVAVAHG